MNYNELDVRLTETGALKLTDPEIDTLQELVDAGDRGAFHFLYGEMADNADSRLTAKISTFSDGVGGAAFAANWKLQQDNSEYAGIYNISQQIAVDILDLIIVSSENVSGTGYLNVDDHFNSAVDTWTDLENGHLFPGNLLKFNKDNPNLAGFDELTAMLDPSRGALSTGAAASIWSLNYVEYTGKKLSDFEGQPGYTILEVDGGKIVIDAEGRTTATFISEPENDVLIAVGSTLLYTPLALSTYDLMGEVGNQFLLDFPTAEVYADARRDFTDHNHPAYHGDDGSAADGVNPALPSYDPVTISISQTATSNRDLLVFGPGDDTVTAGSGDDFILGGQGSDIIFGGNDHDVIWGQRGADYLSGEDGNDTLRGGFSNDQLYGGAGDDILEGADISLNEDVYDEFIGSLVPGATSREEFSAAVDGHDVLMGGTGDDLLLGGFGADILFDSGLEQFGSNQIDFSFDNTALYEYDTGNDTLIGGDGSDLLVYTGGTDTFYGGIGDDTYLISPDLGANFSLNDKLTIVLSEDAADEDTWFGHDYVIGNGKGIDKVVFEGLTSDDVTVTYDYEATLVEELTPELEALFLPFIGIPGFDYGNFPVYSIVGAVTIEVNATGSTLYFSEVGGAYILGSNNPGGSIYVAPVVNLTTDFEFENGTFFSIEGLLEFENFISPVNGATPENADIAPDSQNEELNADFEMPVRDDFGTSNIDFLIGTNINDNLYGDGSDDFLHGAEGADVLVGGTGADYLNGGAGNDTASYADATEAVEASLALGFGYLGEADGDTYVDIEALEGTAFDDTLIGDDGDNTLIGLEGDDYLRSGGGEDYLFGGAGDDRLEVSSNDPFNYLDGGEGNDILLARSGGGVQIGGAGDDRISGGRLADITDAGTGDDVVSGSGGNDQIDGGDGIDLLNHEFGTGNLLDADFIDLGAGTSTSRAFGNDTIVGFENFKGGRAIDIVNGSDGANSIWGNSRNDTLNGLGGNDKLFGGTGNDVLNGGDGDDILYGDLEGIITIYGGDDQISGGNGIDTVVYNGVRSDYAIAVSDGGLFVVSDGEGSDEIASDVEFLTFSDGTFSFEELSASPVNTAPVAVTDQITILEGQTVVFNLLANDTDADGHSLTLTTFDGYTASSTLTLSIGDLDIRPDTDGNVTFEVDAEYTIFPSTDLAPGETYTTTFTYQIDDSFGGTADSTVEITILGAEDPPNYLTGTDADDILVSTELDEEISSGTGEDLYQFGAGDGQDVLSDFDIGYDQIEIDGGLLNPNDGLSGVTLTQDGTDVLVGYGSGDTILLQGVDLLAWETATSTGPTSDGIVTGTSGNDVIDSTTVVDPDGDTINDSGQTINGLGGHDQITAGSGDDVIDGGTHYDTINAGDGNDVVWGGNGRDTVTLGDGDDVFNDNTQTGTHSHDTVYGGNGEDTINGGGGDDTFYGDSHNDLIYGGDGNDTIYGGSHYDTIHGGNGDDQVWGDNGRDTVYLNAGNDTFNDNTQTGTHAHDTVYGGDGDDVFNGGGGDDIFAGDAGSDTLSGGIGNDTLTGGTDVDTFVFSIGDGIDTITDFENGMDLIDLSATGLSFADLIVTTDASGSTIVDYGASDQIEILNTAGQIDQSNFIFV